MRRSFDYEYKGEKNDSEGMRQGVRRGMEPMGVRS